jgi:hypothetical protein
LRDFPEEVAESVHGVKGCLAEFVSESRLSENGRRYSEDLLRFAFILFKHSPAAYYFMRQSVPLPSRQTLFRHLQLDLIEQAMMLMIRNRSRRTCGRVARSANLPVMSSSSPSTQPVRVTQVRRVGRATCGWCWCCRLIELGASSWHKLRPAHTAITGMSWTRKTPFAAHAQASV